MNPKRLRSLALLAIVLAGAGTVSAQVQTKEQRACATGLNKAGAALAHVAARQFVACVKAACKGKLPAGTTAEQCVLADAGGKRAKAEAKAAKVEAKRCGTPPSFGPTTAAAVNAAFGATLRIHDVFGSNLDTALLGVETNPAGAACQVAVAQAMADIAKAKLKVFNACKTAGLKNGSIDSARKLEACIGTDPKGVVAKAQAKAQKTATKKCASVALATALPGECAAAPLAGLFECVEPRVQCGVCLALDGGDRLTRACHRFEDGVATAYCGVRPVTSQSVARQWDEEILAAIRIDNPRPPIHARNLFHLSVAMYDAWAAYDTIAEQYLTSEALQTSDDVERDRAIAISFAAYRVLSHRYSSALALNADAAQAHFFARMTALGLDPLYTSTTAATPAALGNRIGAAIIAHGQTDGANEGLNYADPTYTPVNAPLVVKLLGTTMTDPNRWQALALDVVIAQNGIPLPDKIQKFVGAQWGSVLPFAVDLDTILPPPLLRLNDPLTDAEFKQQAVDLVRLSSQLTPDDPTTIDASPNGIGNNPLGTDDGHGYPVNPATGQPYASQIVKRADFGRVIAEFWADGPQSETPPGHWNTVANYVADHPLVTKRFEGTGPVLDALEWDVKTYFALNAAEHDAAVGCWGTKRVYDGVRPISMVRYMAGLGQSSEPLGPSYHASGIPLVPGLIEVITPESSAAGERHEALAASVGKIAILAWPGEPAAPKTTYSGVKWLLAETWVPYQRKTFVTPPFAGYPSGHSTYSRSAAEVLKRLTGSEYFPGGLGEFAIPQNAFLQFEIGPSSGFHLQWATYFDAADQAGQSRRWGGIHPAVDDLTGRVIGSLIGPDAFDKAKTYFDGTATP